MHRLSTEHCTAQAVRFIGKSCTRLAAIASAVDGSSQAPKPPPIVRQQPGSKSTARENCGASEASITTRMKRAARMMRTDRVRRMKRTQAVVLIQVHACTATRQAVTGSAAGRTSFHHKSIPHQRRAVPPRFFCRSAYLCIRTHCRLQASALAVRKWAQVLYRCLP